MAKCVNTEYPNAELCDSSNAHGVLARWGKCVEGAGNDPDKLKDCVWVYEQESKKKMIKNSNDDGTKAEDTVEGECTCLCAVDENLMDNGVDIAKEGAGKLKDGAEGAAGRVKDGANGLLDTFKGFFKKWKKWSLHKLYHKFGDSSETFEKLSKINQKLSKIYQGLD